MTTWKTGRRSWPARSGGRSRSTIPRGRAAHGPLRVQGTAVFMTSTPTRTPTALLHHLKHNKVLHRQVVLLSVTSEQVPEVPPERRAKLESLGQGFFRITGRYGFMQQPNVPRVLEACRGGDLDELPDTSYYLGRETLLSTGRSGMSRWRKGLFAFISRNATPATAYFCLPPNRVVELGMQIDL